MINKIICGDCLVILKTLPDESVDCCVTSPPYFNLRDYQIEGQIGLEKTYQEYIIKLMAVFDEVKRVLKKEGTCFVNLGDTYGGMKVGNTSKKWGKINTTTFKKEKQYIGPTKGKNSIISDDYLSSMPKIEHIRGILDKSLLLIPERFAISMIDSDLDDDYELRKDLSPEKRKWVLQELQNRSIINTYDM
jgi:hypothetical protein